MGEGTARVEEKKAAPPERPPREIEIEIEHLRARLDRSLAELDRRRHELTDIRLQVRKHPVVLIGTGTLMFFTSRMARNSLMPWRSLRLMIFRAHSVPPGPRAFHTSPKPPRPRSLVKR